MKEEILITSTVAYAFPPKKLCDLKPGNNWYPCVMPISLTNNFKKSLESARKTAKKFASV